MTKETFVYGLNACAVTYHNGQKLYEHDELIKCFEDLGLFEQEPKTDVLDKIRAEIEQIEINGHIRDAECFSAGINTALGVINKYIARKDKK